MAITVKYDPKVPLVVPPAIVRAAGFKDGELVEFRVAGGVITIMRANEGEASVNTQLRNALRKKAKQTSK